MYAIRRGLGADSTVDLSALYPVGGAPVAPVPTPATTPGIVWTDCPDGSTVPANVGCPSYGQTISDFIGANPGTVGIGVAVLFGVILFAKAGR